MRLSVDSVWKPLETAVSVFTHTVSSHNTEQFVPLYCACTLLKSKRGKMQTESLSGAWLLRKQDIYDLCSRGGTSQTDLERAGARSVRLLFSRKRGNKWHAQFTSGLRWRHEVDRTGHPSVFKVSPQCNPVRQGMKKLGYHCGCLSHVLKYAALGWGSVWSCVFERERERPGCLFAIFQLSDHAEMWLCSEWLEVLLMALVHPYVLYIKKKNNIFLLLFNSTGTFLSSRSLKSKWMNETERGRDVGFSNEIPSRWWWLMLKMMRFSHKGPLMTWGAVTWHECYPGRDTCRVNTTMEKVNNPTLVN